MATQFRVESFTASTAIKAPCKAVSAVALTLSGEQTVNGTAVVTNDRVLVKDQADTRENGIYEVDSSAWSRAPDWDGARDAQNGTIVIVANDASQSLYQLSCDGNLDIGTDTTTFNLVNNVNLAGFLASNATGQGASLVGIEDAAARYAATTVEAALTALGHVQSDIKHKTADKDLASTTALEDDNHLFGWNLLADTRYRIEGYIPYTQNVGNLTVAFQISQTPQLSGITYWVADQSGTADPQHAVDIDTQRSFITMTDTEDCGIHLSGYIRTNASLTSVLDFQWAQETSSANDTTVYEGAWIAVTPMYA